jgi:hypothetical protein
MTLFKEQKYVINQTVHQQGDLPSHVYLVLSGTFETQIWKKRKKVKIEDDKMIKQYIGPKKRFNSGSFQSNNI